MLSDRDNRTSRLSGIDKAVETVGIDTDNAYGNNVSNADNCSSNTGNPVKMPWLCMLCKMCNVRVCIGLVVIVAVAFIAIIIAILILMH